VTENPLIIALDLSSAAEASRLVDQLGDAVDFYKVGMELYAAEGISFVRELLARRKRVFLDLKLYDISETVKRATAVLARTGVDFLTVHGSDAVMRAANEGRTGSNLKLLAVTVLTSFDQEDIAQMGYPSSVPELVALRARHAVGTQMDGIVCSPLDAAAVRAIAGPRSILVTPGVRSRTAAAGDQKRIATPQEALAAGASYVVIGREVTRAADPAGEARRILAGLAPATTPIASESRM
jgi:orotidine-5'-phosphate decarboxylase